ncbi:unnamed protein product [Sphacelaria rigidula]
MGDVHGSLTVDSKSGRKDNPKKPKRGEAKVLWSPGRKSGKGGSKDKGGADDGGGVNKGRAGGKGDDARDSRRTGRHLNALMRSFKERTGEELCMDDADDMEGSDEGSESAVPGPRNKRARTRRGNPAAEAAAATAVTMSPAKLAAEVQRARARAREERFGGGAKSKKPSRGARSVVASGTLASGNKTAAQAPTEATSRTKTPPREATAAAALEPDVRRIPRAEHVSLTRTPLSLGAASAPPRTAATGSPAAITSRAHAGSTSSVSDFTAACSGSDLTRSSLPTPLVPKVPTAASEAGAAPAAAVPPRAPILPRMPSPPTQIPSVERSSEKESVKSRTSSSEQVSGGVLRLASTPSTPLEHKNNLSQPHASSKNTQETTADAKVHTLRLRLRADVASNSRPAVPQAPQRAFDGGVEESKGFEPPSPRPDSGVEECKSFDPPNLPLASAARAAPAKANMTLSSKDETSMPAARPRQATPPPGASSTRTSMSVTPSPRRPSYWGPSFGITDAGQPAAVGAITGTAKAPSTSKVPARNPWVLSPDVPTFAKNQGRPLSRSSLQSALTDGVFAMAIRGDGNASSSCLSTAVPGTAKTTVTGRSGSVPRSGRTQAGTLERNTVGHSDSDVIDGGGEGRGNEGAPKANPEGSLLRPGGADSTAMVGSVAHGTQPAALATGAADRQEGRLDGQGEHQPTPFLAVAPSTETQVEQRNAARRQRRASAGIRGTAATPAGASEGSAGSPGGGAEVADEVLLGVRVSGIARDLLERLKKEREESLELERKLAQALLDT